MKREIEKNSNYNEKNSNYKVAAAAVHKEIIPLMTGT